VNLKQRVTIGIGALVLVAMGLYPPWTIEETGFYERSVLEYGWVFDPPSRVLARVSIDLERLAVQAAIVVIALVGLVFILGDHKKNVGQS
jgi:hypothetical protein